MTARGLLLNNPMNIAETKDVWNGQVKPTRDPKKFLAQFIDMSYGLRAGMKNLLAQQIVHHLDTWEAIITKYAPPATNDTAAYIADICAELGCKADDKINFLLQPQMFTGGTKHIIRHEQGSDPIADEVIFQTAHDIVSEHVALTTKRPSV